MHHRPMGRTPLAKRRLAPWRWLWWGAILLTLAATSGCASGPTPVDLTDHPDPVARHFAGCIASHAPDDALVMDCPERELSLLVRAMPLPARAVHQEMAASWPELTDTAPLEALDPGVEQVVMGFTGDSDTPGARTQGLMALADVGPELTRLALCGQRRDADLGAPLDASWCRASLTLLLERGAALPDALFAASQPAAFAGRALELDGLGCQSEGPERIECADGTTVQWLVGSSQDTEQLLADSPDVITEHLLDRGARRLDHQSPPCRLEDAPAECRAVRVAQGRDVVIVLFARGVVRDEHVFVECSYTRDNAHPEIDKNLPPLCAQIMSLE